MKKALLIVDVQVSSATDPLIVKKIEDLQYEYEHVFISRFVNQDSPLLPLTKWDGYADESLVFLPAPHAFVFDKNIFSSFIEQLNTFTEIHICGYDTDACIYKTALDCIEHNIRPVVLTDLCGSGSDYFHQIGLELLRRNIGEENLI